MMPAIPFTLNLHFHASYCLKRQLTCMRDVCWLLGWLSLATADKHMPGIPFYSTNLTVRATAKIAGLVFYTSGIESHKA